MSKHKSSGEHLKALADSLRGRNGVEWNTAKFELRGEAQRIEFFRGKDFVRYFEKHQEVLDEYVDQGGNKGVQDRIEELGVRLLKHGLIRRTERKYKRPKPGQKRLVKWPKSLEKVHKTEDQVWSSESFYVWMYDRPTSAWQYICSTLLVVLVLACCLLPIAPYKVKVWVFYGSVTLLSVMIGILTIRFVVWLVVWLITGKEFWLLPNMLSDDAALKDAFFPLVTFENAEGMKSHWLVRLVVLSGIGGLVFFLHAHSPDRANVTASARKAHDQILDFLSLHDPGMEKIANASNTTTESDPPQPDAGQQQEL